MRHRAFDAQALYGRASMLPVLAVLTACSAATLVLDERLPLALLVIAGEGELESVFSTEDVVRHVTASLSKHTSLAVSPEVKTASDPAIALCEQSTRLSCWARAVRKTDPVPRYLLAISYSAEPNAQVRIATILIDLQHVETRSEDELEQRAAAANDVIAADHAALGNYLRTIIAEKFRADFEANQHFEPYGTIHLEAPRAGFQIMLDGAMVGTSSSGVTVLAKVLPGRRKLALIDPIDKTERTETTLIVRTNETATFSAHAIKANDDSGPMSVQLTFWTGVGLAAAGTILTAWSLTADPQPGRTFATLCEVTERNASCLEKGGPLGAPLGYSIALTGAVWAFGTKLSPDDEAPWVPFVIGLCAGAIAYGVSTALDGGPPAEVK